MKEGFRLKKILIKSLSLFFALIIVFLGLPKTVNGKIRRVAIRQKDSE